MTKNDIASALCRRIPDLSKASALNLIEAVSDILANAFINHENVYLRGLGTFDIKPTKEKKARNINAGTTIIIPAGYNVKFKISQQLKKQINN